MSTRRARLKLGDSWVVEGEDESTEEQTTKNETTVEQTIEKATKEQTTETNTEDPDYAESSSPLKPNPPRKTRRTTRSREPELVMPSLDPSSIDGSWADTRRSYRASRTSRPAERPRSRELHRRRYVREAENSSNSSPEKSPEPAKPVKKAIPKAKVTPPTKEVIEETLEHIFAIFAWVIDVLGRALRILKVPISYGLAMYLLIGLGIMARNLVTSSVYSSLSPICRLPGSSLLNLPFCPGVGGDTEDVPPVHFDQLVKVQSKFEEVLEESAGSVSLPLDMKRGEASIRDLRQLVRYSYIHSKNELVLEFDGFIDTARIASYDLQKFNSHIGRAVDNVLATTRWTTRVLDDIQIRTASRGALNAFINDHILAPFQPVKFTERALLDQYILHTQTVQEEINKLIDEAQALLMVLASLEDRLDVIHGIVTRDDAHARAKKDEVLSELWTLVGGNRSRLSKMNKQLNLLQQVGVYRKSAYAHVSGTILRLQAIGAGLEDLRERIASPKLLREVHVPLAVHIENIQRGVERLEQGRQASRRAENEHIRQTLERSVTEGTLISS